MPGELSAFERFVVSIAIACSLILFVSLYMHYFGIIISLITVYMVALTIILLAVIWLFIQRLLRR